MNKEIFTNILKKDVQFFKTCGFIDYSLLLIKISHVNNGAKEYKIEVKIMQSKISLWKKNNTTEFET